MTTGLLDQRTSRQSQGGAWAYASASRPNLWLQCPLAFKLRQIDGATTPTALRCSWTAESTQGWKPGIGIVNSTSRYWFNADRQHNSAGSLVHGTHRIGTTVRRVPEFVVSR